ncbi:hypothetical protein [Gilvimarinus algae]|uniref:Uncharacterized protein n=1 Tax=Gilvimarinus algae TaxID=3058037 RepID=A0ABT8TIK7_9GAMM|nr:hypothetical protein [Gilvimarinus sp. SDUM040014]MDO3383766.1 hypothetical protein [Gilvimarinus sp. SDUM040014]
MSDITIDNTLQKVLKKILLIIIGSGLVTNALYLYGKAYYEGYIGSLGFEYILFPVKWEETLLWAYFASIDIGVSTVGFWSKLTVPILCLALIIFYLVALALVSIGSQRSKKVRPYKKYTGFSRFLVRCRRANPIIFNTIYWPLSWLFMKRQSLWAFISSYAVLTFVSVVVMLIFVWIYFPVAGVNHGKSVGEKRLAQYETNLCAEQNSYWERCIRLTTDHLDGHDFPKNIYGRIVAKNESLVGVITSEGPVTMTMPSLVFHRAIKNGCYKRDCNGETSGKREAALPRGMMTSD